MLVSTMSSAEPPEFDPQPPIKQPPDPLAVLADDGGPPDPLEADPAYQPPELDSARQPPDAPPGEQAPPDKDADLPF